MAANGLIVPTVDGRDLLACLWIAKATPRRLLI